MSNFPRLAVWLVVLLVLTTLGQRTSSAAEVRFALVVGNDEYKDAKLATPANDAGLVADALQAAGFTVTGARNLDQATLRESFREFLGQVAAAGPDAVVFIYLAGIGLQFAGDNFFVPVDADIQRDVDVPLQAVRISDFTQPLAALPGRVKIVILDAARSSPFARGGQPLAGGLALVDPAQGMAVAFNAAPGTVAPDEQGPYGAYATSLTEMIASGGLSLDELFARVRLRVSELSQGAEIPWYASQIDGPFFMTERAADAPPPPNVTAYADIRSKPIGGYSSAEDAYAAALELDTFEAYEQFLAAYPSSPFARRVAAMLAVRREAIIWRRCVIANTPPAYWSYLRRYPKGPHAWDARRRLTMLSAMLDPPESFAFIDFGVPPPPPTEIVFVDQPVVMFVGRGYAPPPPAPVFFLPPRPREFAALPPPPPPRERFFLPTPAAASVHVFARPPRNVAVQAPSSGVAAGKPAPVALPGAVHAHATPGTATPGTGTPVTAPTGAGATTTTPSVKEQHALPSGSGTTATQGATTTTPLKEQHASPTAPGTTATQGATTTTPLKEKQTPPTGSGTTATQGVTTTTPLKEKHAPPTGPGTTATQGVTSPQHQPSSGAGTSPSPATPQTAPSTALVKPSPVPPAQDAKPALVKPAPPPPPTPPAPPKPAAAKPAACPPGKTPVTVDGRATCK